MKKINTNRPVYQLNEEIMNITKKNRNTKKISKNINIETKISFNNRIMAFKRLADYFLVSGPQIPENTKFDSVYKNIYKFTYLNS